MKMCSIENIIDDAMSYLKDDKGKQASLCHELLDDAVWKYIGTKYGYNKDYKHLPQSYNNGITMNIVFCYNRKKQLNDREIRKSIYNIMRFEIAKQVERYYKYYEVDYNYITKPISVASRIAVLIIMAIMYGRNKKAGA